MGTITLDTLNKFVQDVKSGVKDFSPELVESISNLMKDASKHFYTTSEQTISNGLYDEVRRSLKEIGVTLPIGARPDASSNVKEGTHLFSELVGSLTDITSPDDLIKKIVTVYDAYNTNAKLKRIPLETFALRATLKYDGNSVTNYMNPKTGELIQSLTRGEGDVGVDLTPVFKDRYRIKPLDPNAYDGLEDGSFAIKCEAVVTKDKLDQLNEQLQKDGRNPYMNCRTATSGLLHRLDADKYKDFISLFPIEIRSSLHLKPHLNPDGIDQEHGHHKLFDLDVMVAHTQDYGYNEVDNYFFFEEYCETQSPLEEMTCFVNELYQHIQEIRNSLNFMIDGVVIEILNPAVRKFAGWASGCPNYSFALKFPYFDQMTEITDMEYDFGYLTGRITPCVRFKPVIHNNCTFDRVSIANYKRFRELNFGKGSPALFEYRMDTLGYINSVTGIQDPNLKPFEFIKECPLCGSELDFPTNRDDEQVYVYCRSNECIGNRIGKFIKIFELTNTKGIAESTLKKIIEAGKLTSFASMFMLTPKDIIGIDGLGEVSANSIVESIQSILPLKDWMLVAGLPIEGIGKSKATAICSKIMLLDLLNCQNVGQDIVKAIVDCKIEGIGELTAETIANGINKYRDEILEVYSNFDVQGTVVSADALRICITGGLKYPGKRNALNKFIASKGHIPTDDVSRNTNYLVCNAPSSSDKYRKAEKYGIPIITEEILLNEVIK